jgi:hypothetical protein
VPSEPSPATPGDVWEVTGGQGVAGSNPAVPTGSQVFSNILMPHKSQQKSHLHVNWPLLKARADRAPWRPTRASAKTAEPAKPPIKGSKIAEPPPICTATPAGMRSRRLSPRASCIRQSTRPTVQPPTPVSCVTMTSQAANNLGLGSSLASELGLTQRPTGSCPTGGKPTPMIKRA